MNSRHIALNKITYLHALCSWPCDVYDAPGNTASFLTSSCRAWITHLTQRSSSVPQSCNQAHERNSGYGLLIRNKPISPVRKNKPRAIVWVVPALKFSVSHYWNVQLLRARRLLSQNQLIVLRGSVSNLNWLAEPINHRRRPGMPVRPKPRHAHDAADFRISKGTQPSMFLANIFQEFRKQCYFQFVVRRIW